MQRNDSIDISRGIGILLVILGHSGLPFSINKWIYSFHMPLFFVISGILFLNKDIPFNELLKKITKRLLKPYIFFSIIVYFLLLLIDRENVNITRNIIINGWVSYALWFIPVLIFTEIIFYFIKNANKYFCFFLILCIGFILQYFNFHLPYKLEVCMISIPFFLIGYENKIFLKKPIKFTPYFFIFLCASFFISQYLPKTDLCFNTIGKNGNILLYLLAYINSFIGIYCVFQASDLFSKSLFIKKILLFLGKNTYIILSLHQVIIIFLNVCNINNFIIKYMLLFIVLYIAIFLINKFFKFILS